MKVLVTGGAGFVGSHLVDALVNKGHEVRIFDNLDPQVHGEEQKLPVYVNSKAEFIKGDIRDLPKLKEVIQHIEIIFHLAAVVGVGQSMYQIQRYVEVNTLGTANLLDLLARGKHKVKKLIVASSMSIYGEGGYECKDCGKVYPDSRVDEQLDKHDWAMKCPICKKEVIPVPTNEEKPLQSSSIYAISKKDQEEMSLLVGRCYGIPTIALRYFNIYGPRQALSNPYTGVCAIFSSRIKNKNIPLVFEDGLQSRDFINIKDITQANLLVMENSKADNQVFNVGTGKPTSIIQVVQLLTKLYNKDIEPEIVKKYRRGDIRHCYADITKISQIGFRPRVNLEEGMKDLVNWGQKVSAKDMVDKAVRELEQRSLTK